MRKISSLLMMALLAIGMGLTSCVDDKDNPASNGENVVTPEKEVITEDQMAVTVTADLPTAVLGTFEEGSTGAALVKRLSKVTATIGPDTRMVLLPGSMFDSNSLSAGELDAIVRLSLNGGYLAIERPTAQQLFNFAVVYAAKLFEMQVLTYQELYDMDKAAARRATRSSEMIQRTKARLANIEQIAKTRGGDGLDDVQAAQIGTFYQFKNIADGKVNMQPVATPEANKPYLLKASVAALSAEMVEVKASVSSAGARRAATDPEFVGVFEPTTLSSDAYIYKEGQFELVTTATTLNAFQAYIKAPGATVTPLTIAFITSGIDMVHGGGVDGAPVYYDLQGRRVLYPKKGLYILNGNKVIIK